MKSVILITYSFPPDRNIGAIRPRGLAKYLPHFGWNVFVITPLSDLPRDPKFNVIETYPSFRQKFGYWKKKIAVDYNRVSFQPPLYNRLLSYFCEIIPFPDTKKGWGVQAVFAARQIILRSKIDALISFYRPASSHFVAHKLKSLFPDLFWIADFGDLWSHNQIHEPVGAKLFLLERLEKRIISNADIITTVAAPWAEELKKLHNKESFAIPFGFDPDEYNLEIELDDKFSITYTGSLYQQEKNPEILFMAIKKIFSEYTSARSDFRVHFYGKFNERLQNLINKFGLEEIVKQKGLVPREVVLRRQKSSQTLLLSTPKNIGCIPGKFFEYLGARRPILAIGYEDSVVKDLLEDTKAGVYCWKFEQVYHVLKDWYFEWKKEKIVKYHGIEEKILSYSHKEMAKKFSRLLENFTCS
ncbi:MAG: hypothetical protein NC913_01685 [Candidatus Omnitrophica bacterium]|nr:hypothetical protein [Candidatus Omnitrophota bacterium]